MIKKTVGIFYAILIAVMAAATILENAEGTPFVQANIYGSWWFALLWGLLVAAGVAYIVKRRMRRWNIVLLHASLVVILAGALLTHLTSHEGILRLRGDQPVSICQPADPASGRPPYRLPFAVKLERFDMQKYAGTDAPADYVTRFSIIDGAHTLRAQVSMNKVVRYRGVRFCQASYDSDGLGSYLSVSSDPWGLPVTYAGYALLFFSLIYMLIDPRGAFRRLLASPLLRPAVVVAAFASAGLAAQAAPVAPRPVADRIGRLCMQRGGRVCPVETFALDFVKKVNGRRSYQGLNATEVLTGWMFYGQQWEDEPFIRVKSKAVRERFALREHSSLRAFFAGGTYLLGPAVYEYEHGQRDALHKACADLDDRIALLMEVRQGRGLAMLPYTFAGGRTVWYTPSDEYPPQLPEGNRRFFRGVVAVVGECLAGGDAAQASAIIDKVAAYQAKNGGSSLPSPMQLRAEHAYNAFPLVTLLFIVCLSAGFLSALLMARRRMRIFFTAVMALAIAVLTAVLAMRWIIGGAAPLTNGYETMLFVAWLTMLLALLISRRAPMMLTFGLLMGGFMLLVSHIGDMDPAITPRMPVLRSPLLSVHVSIIMMAYALLSLTFVCAVYALAASCSRSAARQESAQQATALSRVCLYPAITCLGIGIFIGAIWAEVSWGSYWSWDPKETWALITLMVYAVPLHTASLPRLARPRAYHIYMLLAFLSLLVTYFGVNYFMQGMHSYA